MENYNELEQMRQEITSLRERLDRQSIISEEHIRRSMRDKVLKIKTQIIVLSVAGVAGAIFCFWILRIELGFSFALAAATDAFLVAAITFSIWATRKIRPEDMMDENLVIAGKEIARMKKLGILWKKFAYPFLVVWFIWVVVEALHAGLANETVLGFLIGCALGLLGGVFCGMIYDRKQAAMIDSLLKQIDELGK